MEFNTVLNTSAKGCTESTQVHGRQCLQAGVRGVVAALVIASASAAMGQQIEPAPWKYRIHDISQGYESKAYGINIDGEVVGQYRVDPQSEWHAFVYLPNAAYGYAPGFYDIHQGVDESAALSINNEGLIVGYVGNNPKTAYLWSLADAMCGVELQLQVESGTSPCESVAFAINDPIDPNNDPSIAGWLSHGDYFCGNEFSPIFGTTCPEAGVRGFRLDLDENGGFYCDGDGYTTVLKHQWSVENANPTAAYAVGGAHEGEFPGVFPTAGTSGQCVLNGLGLCDSVYSSGLPLLSPGVSWIEPLSDLLKGGTIASQMDEILRAAGLHMNSQNDLVGEAADDPAVTGSECKLRAAFWEDRLDDPILLPFLPLPGGGIGSVNESDTMRAFSIANVDQSNPLAYRVAVGMDEDLLSGALWTVANGTTQWSGYNVNDLICNLELLDPEGNATVVELQDINEGFESCGEWRIGAAGDPRACVVVPIFNCCNGDLNEDGMIGVDDLLLLLADWGDAYAYEPSDINGDGAVDVTDLLELLSLWGPCGNPPGSIPQSVQDCITKYGLDPSNHEALKKCLESK